MTGDRDGARGGERQAGRPGLHLRVTVSGYVPAPVEASFSALDLALRLAELGEQAAATVAVKIARGEPVDLGEHGGAYGWEGHAGSDLGGPLADLADACERHARSLGLGHAALGGSLDPEDVTVAVTWAPDRIAAGTGLDPAAPGGAPLSEPGIGDVHPDDRAAFAAVSRARELARAFVRAGFRAAPGVRDGVELHPDDAARLLAAAREPGIRSVPAVGGRDGTPEPGM